MQVHFNIHQLPQFKNAVVTIGTFDGVHKGHQQIIKQMKTEASAINGETVIITFHPHPRTVITSEQQAIKTLTTLDEKLSLLQQNNIHHVVVVPFTTDFANLSAEEYIQDFLVNKFKPHTIIIGYDHKFGKGRQGNYQLLEAMAKANNYGVKEIPKQLLNEVIVSSTKVRNALSVGDIATANNNLGYAYFFSGIVVKGNQLGRTIGYPTANIAINEDEKLIPANGVYAVTVTIGNNANTYLGMMNIGVRPTVAGTNRTIEVHILHFDEDIYGEKLYITLNHKIREEQKFAGLAALKEQLALDKDAVVNLLSNR